MYQSLYAAKEPLPQSFVDAVEEQVTMLQDEFEAVNTIGKGDTHENERARNRIMGKLAKLKKIDDIVDDFKFLKTLPY